MRGRALRVQFVTPREGDPSAAHLGIFSVSPMMSPETAVLLGQRPRQEAETYEDEGLDSKETLSESGLGD